MFLIFSIVLHLLNKGWKLSNLVLLATTPRLIHVVLCAFVKALEKAIYSKEVDDIRVQNMKSMLKSVGITSYEDDVIPMLIEFKNGIACFISPK